MTNKVWYKLITAVFERRYTDASLFLEEEPGLLESKNGIGETVLHYLVVENDIEGVTWLYE